MLELYKNIFSEAESLAKSDASINDVLKILRQLPIDDFGYFFIMMPNFNYPALSRVLPSMVSAEVQKNWTGSSGIELYRQTAAFARTIAYNYAKYRNKGLKDIKIMDFGVGYGRMIRMFYYWTDPENLWGVDSWQKSLDHCSYCNLAGNFILSEEIPKLLPIDKIKFDLIVSFSVFTHLSSKTALICLSTLRQHAADNTLLIVTFRPIEIWKYFDDINGTNNAKRLEDEHRRFGFAHLRHEGSVQGESYGDTSMLPSFFETDDWTLLSVDRAIGDAYQLIAVLSPK